MPTATPISRVNDFVIRFANVNGSGSASANEMFARAVMRMGVPVAPRNIFPSNIQGLPTWYEVRVSEAGHMGARGGTDLMVAMNPQTFDKDIAGIEPGGYLFYDSTKPLPPSKFREDITVIGVPLTAICNREYTDPRQRQLFKNIIYIGALTALLDMDVKVVEQLIGEQYKGKDKLIEPNIKALHIGRDYAILNLQCPLGIKLKRAKCRRQPHFHRGQFGRRARRGLWRRDRLRLVSDHALVLARRRIYEALRQTSHRPRNQAGQIRDHPGRGRTRLHRHRDRRRLEWRSSIHGHFRPRHFVNAGIHRAGLFR